MIYEEARGEEREEGNGREGRKNRGAKWMEEGKKREKRAKGGCGGSAKDGGRVKKRGKGRREDDVGYEKGECRVAKVTPAL